MIPTPQTTSMRIFILIILLLLCSTLTTDSFSENGQETESDRIRAVVERQKDELMKQLTLRQKIAQLFIIRANGNYVSHDNRRFLHLKRMVEQYQIGGVIFFGGETYNQAIMTNQLQEISRIPLWIAQDMEYGAGMRISDATRITPAMGVAATGNPHWAFEKGRITAAEARSIGVHQVYAPVVDVNNNPENPVINVRSFSEDPEVVSEFAEAFIRGVQSQGVVATAKHFPGHGDTGTDSHLALPVIRHSMERLEAIELLPFRRVIDAGVGSVMTAHIAYPNISSDPRRPATLDGRFMTDMLQNELGFKGLIVTDALEMAGIANHYSPGNAAIEALKAGTDMILLSPDEITAIYQIEQAVRNGDLSEERINQSVEKILTWKIDYGLLRRATVDVNRINEQVNSRRNQMIADQIARESITVLKNDSDIIPINPDRYARITLIAISNHTDGNTGKGLHGAMSSYHSNIRFFNYDSRTSDEELDEMIQSASGSGLVLIGSYLHLATGQRLTFDNKQRSFINRIKALNRPTGLISFSSPYIVTELPEADMHVLAWSMAGSQQGAVASALFGASAVNGKLPITIPGHYNRNAGFTIPRSILRRDTPESAGMSTIGLLEVDRIMEEAVMDSVFPGASLAIIKDGILAYHEAYGYHEYEKRTPMRTHHIFDLASLTKPLATGLAVMKLVGDGKLHLDDSVSKWFSEYEQGSKARVTIQHLLHHTSGLPPFRVYVDKLKTKEAILKAIREEPLIEEPGTTTTYSDLGYILLAEIVAQVAGESIDTFLTTHIYGPLGMTNTSFNPSTRGNRVVSRVVPTEIDTVYRKRTIKAEVHDERAFYLGGVAGHAGLFSTAENLAILMDMMMRGGSYGSESIIKPETLSRFTARIDNSTRALGFDLKSLNGFTTAGSLSSNNTYGHLGFTGTSFWIDPERNLAVVLLTNRTYPYRGTSAGINRVRSNVMDAVIEAIRE